MQHGWRSRGRLPHFEAEGVWQFLTWRTHDSLPASVLRELDEELRSVEESARKAHRIRRIGELLDQGSGECLLANPIAARIVVEAIRYWVDDKYALDAFCVMPNHVHMLIQPFGTGSFARIMQSLKGYTAHEINRVMGRTGSVWQEEYFDRAMRDEEHLTKTRSYIEWNPVKAKLCVHPKDWPYSSAWGRE